MMALFSLAWWSQRLTGVVTQAVGVALVVALIVGALWWLRHDARMDERAAWELRLANARVQAAATAALRERRSEAIAAARAAELAAALANATAARQDIAAELSKLRDGDPVIYPKALARALNR
jgi:hypothetical protein